MNTIVVQPPPVPVAVTQPIPQNAPLLEELVEGVAPRIRFQKGKKQENISEIQKSPLFQA